VKSGEEKMIELLAEMSNWVLDVWDCHGVLKKVAWGVGYGTKEKIDGEWVDIGYFSIPLKKGTTITEEEKEKVKEILWEVIRYWDGGINISGFYTVPAHLLEELKSVLGSKLVE